MKSVRFQVNRRPMKSSRRLHPNENILKHLLVLRKALSDKRNSGYILYSTKELQDEVIRIAHGVPVMSQQTMDGLRALFGAKVTSCEFVLSHGSAAHGEENGAPLAVGQVLNEIHWDEDTLEYLCRCFSRLPPCTVQMARVHELGFHDGLTYLLLYQTAMKEGDRFTARTFLALQDSCTPLERRIKVLMLGYCLGLIQPVAREPKRAKAKRQEGSENHLSHIGFATMILNKIRGL